MKVFQKTTISEILDDRVVYRNLQPYDRKLPGIKEFRDAGVLPQENLPRKSEPAYAEIVSRILRSAWELENRNEDIERVIFVGDTRMLDGTAFENLCTAGNWPGFAFIASENQEPAEFNVEITDNENVIVTSNRWVKLKEFDDYMAGVNSPVDENCVVILDLDKTTIGARGRNSQVIDNVRMEAVRQTVEGFLGDEFRNQDFILAYQTLNMPKYHTFTGDNQDYLAYICLILGSGYSNLNDVKERLRSGSLTSFDQFIQEVDKNRAQLPSGLHAVHRDIFSNVESGDPTPFKDFRKVEYKLTVGSMGNMDEHDGISSMLAREIVITEEVRRAAMDWRGHGAMTFGLSDKPDEASIPDGIKAKEGFLPIHRTSTHSVGE